MKEQFLDILAEVCEDDIVKTDMNINIVEEDLIDSMGFIELLVQIEDCFGIVIAPSEYTREEFNTPQKILDILKGRIGEK